MSYSININKAKIEVTNIEVTTDHIIVHAMFYFANGYMHAFHKDYPIATFNQSNTIAEMKLAWNTINAKKQYEEAFRTAKPAAAYIDTPGNEFP